MKYQNLLKGDPADPFYLIKALRLDEISSYGQFKTPLDLKLSTH